jgi:hypothetical protein
MFSDPQSVTVNAVAKTLPRVVVGDRKASYESTADGLQLHITHVVGKRNRHTVRLDVTKTAADPLLDGVSKQYSMSAYIVVDAPPIGFTLAEQKLNVTALLDFMKAATNTDKVLAGES